MIKQVNSHSKGGNEVNYIYFHKAHPLPYKAEPTTRRTQTKTPSIKRDYIRSSIRWLTFIPRRATCQSFKPDQTHQEQRSSGQNPAKPVVALAISRASSSAQAGGHTEAGCTIRRVNRSRLVNLAHDVCRRHICRQSFPKCLSPHFTWKAWFDRSRQVWLILGVENGGC